MKELMNLANRVARRLWNDPEAESVAGECLLNAIRTFDPENGTPLSAYTVACVKMGILYAQRRKANRREEFKPIEYWINEVYDGGSACVPTNAEANLGVRRYGYRTYTENAELHVSSEDWKLLVEYYIDKKPLDVVARRRSVTVYKVRKLLKAAVVRFTKSNV